MLDARDAAIRTLNELMNVVHVIPMDDLREHEPLSSCWCHPFDQDETPGLMIHTSMDGREAYESGERRVH